MRSHGIHSLPVTLSEVSMSDELKALPGEINIGDDDMPIALAIRTSVNMQTGEKRALVTLRMGPGAEKIVFNFGNYGGGVQTFGGDPGGGGCP